MARTQDRISLHVYRGKLNSAEHELIGQWFEYRMKEIYSDIHQQLAGYYDEEVDRNKLKYAFQMQTMPYGRGDGETSPTQYYISGYTDRVGMTEIFQTAILRITEAFEIMKPFVNGARIDFSNCAVRSPFVSYDPDRGFVVNTSKELEIRLVGKKARLGNGCPGKPIFDMAGMPLIHDTQIQDIWVIGEPTAARKVAGMTRNAFMMNHEKHDNDTILSGLASRLDNKTVLVIKTTPDNHDGEGCMVVGQNPIQLPEFWNKDMQQNYVKRMTAWHPTGPDKFDYLVTERNQICPVKLLKSVIDHTGFELSRYVNFRIKDALHNGNA